MRILVIEDDADVGGFLRRALTDAGHTVEWADNGADGMTQALSRGFELVILDRQLDNGVDGIDILKAMRANAITVPALFLSGLGELSDWVAGLQAGGDDYMVKPVVLEDLLARVAAVARREEVVGEE